jgi:hypothetical protein
MSGRQFGRPCAETGETGKAVERLRTGLRTPVPDHDSIETIAPGGILERGALRRAFVTLWAAAKRCGASPGSVLEGRMSRSADIRPSSGQLRITMTGQTPQRHPQREFAWRRIFAASGSLARLFVRRGEARRLKRHLRSCP